MMCIDVRGRILVFIVVVFDRKDIFFYFLDKFKFLNVKCEEKLIIKRMKRDLGKLEKRNYYFKCCRKELVL